MIDKLLNAEVLVDGDIVSLRDGYGATSSERYIYCSDGSAALIGYTRDAVGELWWLDVFNDGQQLGITVTSAHALRAVGFEACANGGLIYDLLFFASALLRWRWWKHAVVIWRVGELRLCDRKWLEGKRVVFDIVSVDGVRFDEMDDEDAEEEAEACGC